MLSDSTLAACERLAGVVAPELQRDGVPIYSVNLPAEYPAHRDLAAFTGGPGVAELVRASLTASGRWRGPGVNIVFCHDVPHNEALGIALHELSHRLPYTRPRDIPASVKTGMRHLSAVGLLHREPFRPMLPRWCDGHDLQFHRIALHLHYRSWQAGHEIGLPMLHIFGEPYDLGPAYKYMHALRPECERLIAWPFKLITALRPPREFVALWEEDFINWFRDSQRNTQCQTC